MTTLPAGTVTFLAIAIDPETTTTLPLPDAVRERIEANDGYLAPWAAGTLGAFSSALAAVTAALDARRGFPPGTAARLVVHSGPVSLREGRYSGPVVARLGPLLQAIHPGQLVVTSVTRELVRDYLPAGVELVDLGPCRLRDLLRPIRLFQVTVPGDSDASPPLDSLDSYLHNLPTQATSFLGREAELAEGRRLLAESHLVTLAGIEGTGKSRLALQLAADQVHRYPDGAWRVDLAAVTDGRRVPEQVIHALGLREQPDAAPADSLLAYLRDRRLLLVLDNCERQVEAIARLVTRVEAECPDVRLLITSHEPLGLPGETVLAVPPLGIPLRRSVLDDPPTGVLTQYEAVQLFLERAAAAQPGFEPTNDSLPAIAEICHRVDGIPLAIEITAARVADLPVDDVAFDLAARYDDISGGARLPLPRDQILGEAIAWAAERLPEAERRLLARLAVFSGRFGLDGALAVCAREGLAPAEVGGALWSLVGKGMVKVRPDAGTTEFQLLEPIRLHALKLLNLAGEEPSTRARHLAWCLQWARAAEEVLAGPEPMPTLGRLERQHDNFRAALDWGLEPRRQGWDGVELAGHLGIFWYERGHFREGREWLERARSKCAGASPQGLQAWVAYYLGAMLVPAGDNERAEGLFEESLALFRGLGDKRGVGWALNDLGLIALNRGQAAEAGALLEQSLTVKRELGNELDIGVTVSNLGEVARLRGDTEQARRYYEESLTHLRQVRRADRSPRAIYPLMNLGYMALHDRNPAAAAAYFRAALELERDLGDPRSTAAVLAGLGGVATQRGQLERAARLFGATEAQLAGEDVVLDRTDRTDVERHVNLARGQMEPTAWDATHAEGRTMSLAEAVRYGLEVASLDL